MKYLSSIALLILQTISFSQESSLSTNKIQIGEEVVLTYRITLATEAAFRHIPFGTTVPAKKKSASGTLAQETSTSIEQLKSFNDTVLLKGKTKEWIGTYQLTAWDEGSFVIEGAKIQVGDSMILFPAVTLTAQLVATKKDLDLYDIREQFADLPEPPHPLVQFFTNNREWLVPALIVLGLAVLLFILWWRSQKKPSVPEQVISLKERSLLAIDALERERLWEKNKLKTHYIELSYILRSYLSSRYQLSLLENTSKEAQLLLKQKGLHPETIRTIGIVLDQSDLVKFARSKPDEQEILKISQLVRQVIAETSPLEFDRDE